MPVAVQAGASDPDELPAALDRSRLDLLGDVDEGDPAYLNRIIDRFATTGPALLATIEAAESPDDLKFRAHKLAGTAANLGLPRVAELARDLEQLADSGTMEGASTIVEDLRTALRDGLEALADYGNA